MVTALEKSWKLEEIFEVHGALTPWLEELDAQLAQIEKAYGFFETEDIAGALEIAARVNCWIQEGFGFISCLMAEDPHFTRLSALQGSILRLESSYELFIRKCNMYLGRVSDEVFAKTLADPRCTELTHFLNERRRIAKSRLSLDKEEVIWDLARFCYFPLARMFTKLNGSIRFVSYGGDCIWNAQEARDIWKTGDKGLRSEVFEAAKSSCHNNAPVFAQLLNQVTGFRKSLSRLRHSKGPYQEGIESFRVNDEFYKNYIDAIDTMKAPLILFLKHEAQLQNVRKLGWQDLAYHVPASVHTKVSWKEGKVWVQAGLARASSELGEFFTSLDRKGHIRLSNDYMDERHMPSFSTSFPKARQHRAYISDNEEVANLLNAAQMFSQLWRKEQLFSKHPLNQESLVLVSQAVASLCERFVLEVIKERAQTRQHYFEALYLHLKSHVHTILSSRKLCHFDEQIYSDLNQVDPFSEEQLSKMMEKSQRETYASQLSQYFPHEWMLEETLYDHYWACSHWGQGAGMILGLGLYQNYLGEPKGFSQKIKQLASLCSESPDVGKAIGEIFSIDLNKRTFWNTALKSLEIDMQEMAKIMRIKDKTFNIESKYLD